MADGYEPRPFESQIGTTSIVMKPSNDTTFTFDNLNGLNDTSRFRYALLVWGTNSTSFDVSMMYINVSNEVYFKNLGGSTGRTFTGSISNGQLTITASAVMYGGVRLIWLN